MAMSATTAKGTAITGGRLSFTESRQERNNQVETPAKKKKKRNQRSRIGATR
jgi:hypothetical protein